MCRAKQVWERGKYVGRLLHVNGSISLTIYAIYAHVRSASQNYRTVTISSEFLAATYPAINGNRKKCAGASATTSEMTAIAHTPFTPPFPLPFSFPSFPPRSSYLLLTYRRWTVPVHDDIERFHRTIERLGIVTIIWC